MNYLILPHFWLSQKYCQRDGVLFLLFTRQDTRRTLGSKFQHQSPAEGFSPLLSKGLLSVAWIPGDVWDLVLSLGWAGWAIPCLFTRKHRLPNLLSKTGCRSALLEGKAPSVLITLTVGEGTVVKRHGESSGRPQLHVGKNHRLSSWVLVTPRPYQAKDRSAQTHVPWVRWQELVHTGQLRKVIWASRGVECRRKAATVKEMEQSGQPAVLVLFWHLLCCLFCLPLIITGRWEILAVVAKPHFTEPVLFGHLIAGFPFPPETKMLFLSFENSTNHLLTYLLASEWPRICLTGLVV